MTTFVIVGGGLAGAKAAETLRTEGFDGEIVLFGDESEVPYERPPLSKDYLLGKKPRESAYVHPAEWYAENSVDLRAGVSVAAIERPTHTVICEDGTQHYDKLLLATGATPRRLDVPGEALDGVRTLRKLPDSDALRQEFTSGRRCPRTTCSARSRGSRPTCTPPSGTRSTRSTCAPASASPRSSGRSTG